MTNDTTTTGDTTERLKNLMAREGGLIIFGPQYLAATMALVDVKKNQKAVFSGAKIDDLPIPEALMISCDLIFCHSLTWCRGRGVNAAELKDWTAKLVDGIAFKPSSVPGLKASDIKEPSKQITADEKTNDLLFLLQWGPVPSKHCVEVARSLERAYARLS